MVLKNNSEEKGELLLHFLALLLHEDIWNDKRQDPEFKQKHQAELYLWR